MTLLELQNRYQKAHEVFLQYQHTNKTNDIEAANMPIILNWLKEIYPDWNFIVVPDCFLNYIGVDIIGTCSDTLRTFDIKICNGDGRGNRLTGNNVLVDVMKKDKDGSWHYVFNDKCNDVFIFKNAENIFMVNSKIIYNIIRELPEEELFFMPRDLKKTTKKAIISLEGKRKIAKNLYL